MNNLIGQRFGRWSVIERAANDSDQPMWKCLCDCGNSKWVRGAHLRGGKSQSCGCLAVELAKQRYTVHGMKGTPEYKTWLNIRQRCTNPKHISFKYYGAMGVKVCERWQEFASFFADMGVRPDANHSIDRVRSSGDYEPSNCRWATETEQQNNRRNNLVLTHNGEAHTEAEWCRKMGFKGHTIGRRIKQGWSTEKAVTTPV